MVICLFVVTFLLGSSNGSESDVQCHRLIVFVFIFILVISRFILLVSLEQRHILLIVPRALRLFCSERVTNLP